MRESENNAIFELQKVKITPDGGLCVNYKLCEQTNCNKFKIQSTNAPHPDMLDLFDKLQPIVAQVFGMADCFPLAVCGLTIGGKGESEPVSEGEGMIQYLVKQGIEPARIIVEDRALNTVQNIQFSKRLMSSPDASTALVTNNFHVSRAAALARKQGITNVYAIAAPSDPAYLPNNMFREFFGLTKDFLAGNL